MESEGDWDELGTRICLLRESRKKYLQQNGVME